MALNQRFVLLLHPKCLQLPPQSGQKLLSTAAAATNTRLLANNRSRLPERWQKRTIVDKYTLPSLLPYDYPQPWPYKEKGFPYPKIYLGGSKKRHHVNSKLIVVEGNIGSGKTEFASRLADELDFHFMPAFSMNEILIDRYGNDLRKFYDLFPKRFRVPDELSFYKDPGDDNTAVMQDTIYFSKWEQYCNALAHIFNTGQGVVLERSVYSDFVFANAMRAKDWISMEYFKYYYFQRKCTLPQLRLWPHLLIYLDCPVDKCLERVRERGDPDETAAVDEHYLRVIENSYKDFLRELKRHSHVLTYDWSEPHSHMDWVMDDVYSLDMDHYDWHQDADRLFEWFCIGKMDESYGWRRHHYTHKRDMMANHFGPLYRLQFEVSELYIYPPDMVHMKHVMMFEVLKSFYTYGWTEKDKPQAGLFNFDDDLLTPERWFEYFFKDYWYNAQRPYDFYFDPTGQGYNPGYLHH